MLRRVGWVEQPTEAAEVGALLALIRQHRNTSVTVFGEVGPDDMPTGVVCATWNWNPRGRYPDDDGNEGPGKGFVGAGYQRAGSEVDVLALVWLQLLGVTGRSGAAPPIGGGWTGR